MSESVVERNSMKTAVKTSGLVLSKGVNVFTKQREGYIHGAIGGRWPSANTLERSTPTPSNTPSSIPQATAEPSADLGPPKANNHEQLETALEG